jgi:hypothetical protein
MNLVKQELRRMGSPGILSRDKYNESIGPILRKMILDIPEIDDLNVDHDLDEYILRIYLTKHFDPKVEVYFLIRKSPDGDVQRLEEPDIEDLKSKIQNSPALEEIKKAIYVTINSLLKVQLTWTYIQVKKLPELWEGQTTKSTLARVEICHGVLIGKFPEFFRLECY